MSHPDYQRFVGFAPREVDRVSAMLQAKGIRFDIFLDQESYQELEHEWKTNAADGRRGPSFDPHHICFDVAIEDLAKLDEECRQAGFGEIPPETEAPDFDAEEYLCPRCDHHQATQGLCPKHSETLLKFSEWNETRNRQDQRQTRNWGLAVLFLAAAFGVYKLITMQN